MLRAILNKSWRQHPTKQQQSGHLPSITKTIQFRRTRHTGHCWRSGDELISDVLLWTPWHGRAKAGRLTRTYIQQLCADTGCSLEGQLKAMDDREGWWERFREIYADGAIWWWWIKYRFVYDGYLHLEMSWSGITRHGTQSNQIIGRIHPSIHPFKIVIQFFLYF